MIDDLNDVDKQSILKILGNTQSQNYFERGLSVVKVISEELADVDFTQDCIHYFCKDLMQFVEPESKAYKAISELYHKYGSEKVVNITTNVDDLLEGAGVAHNDVMHVHGYLPEIKYTRDDRVFIKDVGYSQVNVNDFDYVKPNVVFFGENAPLYADMYNEFDKLKSGDLVVVVGCSNQVINFNWELFPMLNIGVRMCVVNPDINYIEQQGYEERGVIVYRDTSSNVFGDKSFINFVQSVLEK